jgi:hypothetical protein
MMVALVLRLASAALGSRRQAAWAQAIETVLVAKVIRAKHVRRVELNCAATNGTHWEEVISRIES